MEDVQCIGKATSLEHEINIHHAQYHVELYYHRPLIYIEYREQKWQKYFVLHSYHEAEKLCQCYLTTPLPK